MWSYVIQLYTIHISSNWNKDSVGHVWFNKMCKMWWILWGKSPQLWDIEDESVENFFRFFRFNEKKIIFNISQNIHSHTHKHTYTHAHKHTHMHVCISLYAYFCIDTYTHTHTLNCTYVCICLLNPYKHLSILTSFQMKVIFLTKWIDILTCFTWTLRRLEYRVEKILNPF